MNSVQLLRTVILLLTISPCANIHAASIFDWSEIFRQSVKQLKKANEDIEKLRKVVNEIEEGKPVSATQNKWGDLAASYTNAAANLTSASLPSAFDKSAFTVSLTELSGCSTRPASLMKLRNYADALNAAQITGSQQLAEIDQTLIDLSSARMAIKYLVDVNKKLIGVPLYGELFLWNWFDLEVVVSKAIGSAISDLSRHRKVLTENIDKSNVAAKNLISNITLLEGVVCEISGTWTGECTSASGLKSKLIVSAARVNGQYNCLFTRPGGASYACREFTFNESNGAVGFKAQQVGQPKSIDWRGTMREKGKVMSVTYAIGTATGSCLLNQ